jgi:Rieske Fe-S protein
MEKALSEARAYTEPGSPEEITRRTFMANAVIVIGGVIGLTLTIPLLGSLAPIAGTGGGAWSPLSDADFKAFVAATDTPVRISLTVKSKDGYLPESDNDQFIWGIKMPEAKVTAFKAARPDLYVDPTGKVEYPVVNLGFVMFSSICPHLGCKYNYDATSRRFACPCHGSQFDGGTGEHVAGPAPRGLDPLPFRESNGQAEVTWIDFRSSDSARIIVAYS